MKVLNDETKTEEIISQLEDLTQSVKNVGTTFKKAASAAE
jgi:hypothetical protein